MFFIACFEHLPPVERDYDIGDCRTVGYFDNYNNAALRLHNNACDLYEDIYDYAIIEEVEQGLYPNVKSRKFFKYDKEQDGFFEIEEPEQLKQFCNFSIG